MCNASRHPVVRSVPVCVCERVCVAGVIQRQAVASGGTGIG